MKYICVQPRVLYFAWQLEIMIKNFLSNGIKSEDIEILVAINPLDDTCSTSNINSFKRLEGVYPEVKFFYYEDTRTDKNYIPSVYFNIIKQHYNVFPELSNQVVFCHDCDILFTHPVNFSEMESDNIWYLSDTVSYIWSDYIHSKGEEIYDEMCNIVGIGKTIPILNKHNSGGAQYITKNATAEFWEKIEQDSISLYKYFVSIEKNYVPKHPGDYPIQKWTAGMWAFLWNIWLFGFETKVDKRLDFCWATCPIERYSKVPIFHNAGVTHDKKTKMFFKGDYTSSSPIGQKFNLDPQFCSVKYGEAVTKCREDS